MAETLRPGASVAAVAQRYGINANLVFKWRRAAGTGEPATAADLTAAPAVPARPAGAATSPDFVPIGVFGRAEDEGPAMLVAAPRAAAGREGPPLRRPTLDERPGVIEVDLPDGARIRVDAFVNAKALKRVLSVLKSLA